MKYMYKFFPYITNDSSVGLYNDEVGDIYHSAYGALTEAYEKFINPIELEKITCNKKEVNILDICYGIGYNTKGLITKIINNKYNNYGINFNIDCVDTDFTLMSLSPFIKTKINFWDRLFYKRNFDCAEKRYEPIETIKTKQNLSEAKYEINRLVNYIILKNLISDFGADRIYEETEKVFSDRQHSGFFDKNMFNIMKFLYNSPLYLHQNKNKSTFVHNIYYKYISYRYKKVLNSLKNQFNIHFLPLDIRQHLLNTDRIYDIAMLDGFTPSKCPCIWTVDVFQSLYAHLSENGILVTYNTSAPVRNALKMADFNIGNVVDKNNKTIGTIAAKNNNYIKHSLTEIQNGLLNTKAGIPYRDDNLSLDNDIILLNRKLEFDKSTLESSSSYYKKRGL